MAIEHRDIIDSERHEVKGASSATVGQVLQANGDGTTTFVSPNTLANIGISSSIEGQSTTAQNPAAVDTALQVTWGAGSSNSDVTIASNGVVTFLSAGLYLVTINLNFARTTGAGNAILGARLLTNGVASGFTQTFRMSDSTVTIPFYTSVLRSFAMGDAITVQIIRDSTGINNGGLLPQTIAASGWTAAPSAAVRVQKVAGGA